MKSKTSTYITWAVIVALLIGGIALISRGKSKKEEVLAEKYQDVKDDKPADSGASAITSPAEGPYKTEGGNDQENDNFFIKGRVQTLQSLVETDKNATVVWVSASWCEICHAMRPFVWKSANKFADKVAIKEIDYDDNPSLVQANQILGTPAFFVLNKQGNVVTRFSGATQSMFEAQLEKASQLN